MRTLLRGGWLLGVRRPTPPGSALLIEGERVVAVLDPAQARAATADQVLDLGGTTLLPGLIDAHVHLVMSAGPTNEAVWSALEADAADGLVPRRVARNAAAALRAGITTLRDLGDREGLTLDLRRAAQDSQVAAPNLELAGMPVTSAGAHLHRLGLVASGVDEVRAAVRRLVDMGVDWIKVMASGGNMTPESDALRPQFNASELTALVDESQAAGKRVAAHALCTAAIRQAVQAGVDTIEHGLWRDENGRFDWDETVVSLMAQRGVAVTATLGGYLRAWAVPDQVGHPRAALMEFWQQYARLRAAGVRVIAASDGGVRVTPIEQPAGMLCLLVSGFGLTTPEALELLTAEPAAALGVRDRGWLGAGARADVVAVDGELERDPSRLGRVRMVMLNGAIVKA